MSAVARLPDGLLLRLRLTPGARRAGLEGEVARDDGRRLLKIKVTEPPEEGRANAALLALLAKGLGLPKRALSLQSGATAREKTVKVLGEPAALEARLAAWLRAGTGRSGKEGRGAA